MANRKNAKSAKSAPREQHQQQNVMLGDGLSFAAAEAYKLLRTNLLFSLPDKPCRIVGVTSSVRGEGKSTTSVNLAYTLAESGKRVLLSDADMRLPSVATKLSIAGAPGLSNLLAGLREEWECMRVSTYFSNWYILPAGDIPPNPSELLGSERMCAMLERYAGIFDFVLVDLPPVTVVTDALAISSWIDGLMVVVRQNYTERRALKDCMYQIQKLGSKFLGFVMTDADVSASGYKRYGKYGKNYGYGYGYGYDSAEGESHGKQEKAFIEAAMDRPAEAAAAAEAAAESVPAPEKTESAESDD